MEEISTPAADQQQWALNLCDIVPWHTLMAGGQPASALEWVLGSTLAASPTDRWDRLYVGSYFCEHYFCSLTPGVVSFLRGFARAYDLALTLVIPVCSQGMLEQAHSLVRELVFPQAGLDDGAPFDEVVVNDYGMASYVRALLGEQGADSAASPRLIRGRLLARCLRDPRYPVFDEEPQPYPLDAQQAEYVRSTWGISALECDPFAPVVDTEPLAGVMPVQLHAPHAYMSTGHICEYASERRFASQKFRASAPCALECLGSIRIHQVQTHVADGVADQQPDQSDGMRTTYLTKMGRSIFFENPQATVIGQQPERIIWTPDDFLCGRGVESWG